MNVIFDDVKYENERGKGMIQTWDWLFLHLPKNEEKRKMVIENIKSQKYEEIEVNNYVLKIDFKTSFIYCDCTKDYRFKHKVIPGRVTFEYVNNYLTTGCWSDVDENELELLDR